MTRQEYLNSQEIPLMGYSFHALIMAAMRQADTNNLKALKHAFPHVWDELSERYNAPSGYLEGEQTGKE